mmetsp:Transcript_62958/g.149996  ORF Transcript_62958/g.149996 Transcript_62958/m.149996 type:complete len:424 (-) Transcript_62958:26-1297(-)
MMMRCCAAVLLIELAAAVRPSQSVALGRTSGAFHIAFHSYMRDYRRTYAHGSPEYEMRQAMFERTFWKVHEQNRKPESERLWTAGFNEYSDRTEDEMRSLNGWRPMGVSAMGGPSALLERGETETFNGTSTDLPESVDWSSLWTSQLGQIRSQTCGNCWAEATASMLEAHLEIHTGVQKRISGGQITRCTPNPYKCGGGGGCTGATSELAMGYLMQISKDFSTDETLEGCPDPEDTSKSQDFSEKEPPHEWAPGVRSAVESAPVRKMMSLVGWERLPVNKLEPLLRALYTRGPVAVAVATDWGVPYKSGIFDSCSKDPTIGHAMLAVGYGVQDGTKYWTLQNSWGTGFGENGKMRLLRGDDEESFCGTDKHPEEGTTCEGGPRDVKACGRCGILFDTVVPHFAPLSKQGKDLAKLRGEPVSDS